MALGKKLSLWFASSLLAINISASETKKTNESDYKWAVEHVIKQTASLLCSSWKQINTENKNPFHGYRWLWYRTSIWVDIAWSPFVLSISRSEPLDEMFSVEPYWLAKELNESLIETLNRVKEEMINIPLCSSIVDNKGIKK